MGPYPAAYDAAGTRLHSPRSKYRGGGGWWFGCCSRCRHTKLLAVLGLIALAGCSTIVLQFMAGEFLQPKHKLNTPTPGGNIRKVAPLALGHISASDSGPKTVEDSGRAPRRSGEDATTGKRQPGRARREIGSPVVPEFSPRPLVDRRFSGQRTGRTPRTDEELYIPPPSKGPWGWGTDWSLGVSVEHEGEDLIEPPWCIDAPENLSFVEHVMERRVSAPVDRFNRVASCVRTKDSGRYLPEWVAYHWALGVDEFVVLDDQSIDDTREVLEPFIQAGVVKYRRYSIAALSERFDPLNECVRQYENMHRAGHRLAPRWVLLIDTDEYMWSRNLLSTLADVFATYSASCSLKVSRVQHGSSGFSKPPRGLVIENFVSHADPMDVARNGLPKVVINLRPEEAHPDTLDHHLSTDHTSDCPGEAVPIRELSVRHYSMTFDDFKAKTRRYWTSGRHVARTDEEIAEAFRMRDVNDQRSEDMLAWSCVVRHVLSRAANGKDILTGKPSPGLSPHHPVVHGMRPLDPFGDQEAARTAACLNVVQESPTVTGTVWGNSNQPPEWLEHLCGTRYVFVHSIEGSGDADVVRLLAAHEWVMTHTGKAATAKGGCALTSSIPVASDMRMTTGEDLAQLCGCSSRGCWRYCPALGRRLLTSSHVNKTRRQLMQDWLLRFNPESMPGKPLVLVERDSDMLLQAKQDLFPLVSTSIAVVRHPLCTPGLGTILTDVAEALAEWRSVWTQLLLEQAPNVRGDVWAVRFEDVLAQEKEVASALWAAIGLPPISPFPPADDAFQTTASVPARGGAGLIGRAGEPDDRMHVGTAMAMAEIGEQRKLGNRERAAAPVAGVGGGNGVRVRADGSGGRYVRRRLITGDALSKAPRPVQTKAIPPTCKARVKRCEKDPQCDLELERSAVLLDFFGYGGKSDMLKSQLFLWGKEELVWLGKRLAEAPAEHPEPLSEGAIHSLNSSAEESVILPQAYGV